MLLALVIVFVLVPLEQFPVARGASAQPAPQHIALASPPSLSPSSSAEAATSHALLHLRAPTPPPTPTPAPTPPPTPPPCLAVANPTSNLDQVIARTLAQHPPSTPVVTVCLRVPAASNTSTFVLSKPFALAQGRSLLLRAGDAAASASSSSPSPALIPAPHIRLVVSADVIISDMAELTLQNLDSVELTGHVQVQGHSALTVNTNANINVDMAVRGTPATPTALGSAFPIFLNGSFAALTLEEVNVSNSRYLSTGLINCIGNDPSDPQDLPGCAVTLRNSLFQNVPFAVVLGGINPTLTVQDCTFIGNSGHVDFVGILQGNGGIFVINSCIFRGNNGGIAQRGGPTSAVVPGGVASLSVSGCLFQDNEFAGAGAVYAQGVSFVLMQNNQFLDNRAPFAAAVFCSFCGSLSTTSMTAMRNTVYGSSRVDQAPNGAVVYAKNTQNTWVDGEFVSNNFTVADRSMPTVNYNNGGAVAVVGSSPNTAHGAGTFFVYIAGHYENNAGLCGGALYISSFPGNISISGSFVGNSAPNGGGAIHLQDLSPYVLINTSASNWASHSEPAQFTTIQNSLFAANTARDDGGAIFAQNVSGIVVTNANFTSNRILRSSGTALSALGIGSAVRIISNFINPSNLGFVHPTCPKPDEFTEPNCTAIQDQFRQWSNQPYTATFTNVHFTDNRGGSALAFLNTNVRLFRSVVAGNVGSQRGGGIFAEGTTSVELTNSSQVIGNSISSSGAGGSPPGTQIYFAANGNLTFGSGSVIVGGGGTPSTDEQQHHERHHWQFVTGKKEEGEEKDEEEEEEEAGVTTESVVFAPDAGQVTFAGDSVASCAGGASISLSLQAIPVTFFQDWALDCRQAPCRPDLARVCGRGNCAECRPVYPRMLVTALEVVCLPCPDGMYALSASLQGGQVSAASSCLPCPTGASCVNGHLGVKEGHWGVFEPAAPKPNAAYTLSKTSPLAESVGTEDRPVFYRCPSGYCCEEERCEDIATCAHHRSGRLCGVCEPGYALSVSSPACIAKEDCNDAAWFVPLVVVMSFAFAALLMGQPQHWTWSAFHLVVFFYQMADAIVEVDVPSHQARQALEAVTAIPELFEFALPAFVGEVCLKGLASAGPVRVAALRLVMPLCIGAALAILDGLRRWWRRRRQQQQREDDGHGRQHGPAAAHHHGQGAAQVGRLLLWTFNLLLSTAFHMVHCVKVEDSDGDVLFWAGEQRCGLWQVPFYVFMALLLLPVVLAIAARHWRGLQRVLVAVLQRTPHAVQDTLVSLGSHFAPHAWHWNAVMALHRAALSALAVFLRDNLLRVVLQITVSLGFLGAQLLWEPFGRGDKTGFGKRSGREERGAGDEGEGEGEGEGDREPLIGGGEDAEDEGDGGHGRVATMSATDKTQAALLCGLVLLGVCSIPGVTLTETRNDAELDREGQVTLNILSAVSMVVLVAPLAVLVAALVYAARHIAARSRHRSLRPLRSVGSFRSDAYLEARSTDNSLRSECSE